MFMEDKFGNMLLRVLNQKVSEGRYWGGGQEFNNIIKKSGAQTVTFKLNIGIKLEIIGRII